MQHHKVFSQFPRFHGEVRGGFQADDFLGTMVQLRFRSLPERWEPVTVDTPYPAFDEEYFEWIDLLESVIHARRAYTMIELGAGFGRWAVRVSWALRYCHPGMPFHLIAVEPEPMHFDWMRTHFRDNGIDPEQHTLIQAAVSDTPGETLFYVGACGFDRKPAEWYGQSLSNEDRVDQTEPETYCGFPVHRHSSGNKSIYVPSVSLSGILQNVRRVDLLDIDIQAEEGTAIRSAIHALNAKVKRLHVGTHLPEIEIGLRELLRAHGWKCLADYPVGRTSQTSFGAIAFQDGVQSWLNPRLSGPWWSRLGRLLAR